MALESYSFNYHESDELNFQVNIIFDREDRSHEIEAVWLLEPVSQNLKMDVINLLEPFGGSLWNDIENKALEKMQNVAMEIDSGLYDYED